MADKNIDTSQTAKNILGQLIAQGLNPLQQNVLKTVQKKQAEQINQAIDQGVPVENILKQSGIPLSEQEAVGQISDPNQPAQLVGDKRSQVSQALAGQPQQPQQPQRPDISSQ